MTSTIFECRTKATTKEGYRLRWSINWLLARRSKLVLTERDLICGDWAVPYREIEDALLLGIPTRVGVARNLIVKHRSGVIYHFQFYSDSLRRHLSDPFWDGPLPFAARRSRLHAGRWIDA